MEMKNVATMEVEIKESGPQGEPGPRGLSAYEVYLENGGTLSETDWLESLKGETGNDGVDGKDGNNGKDGYTPVKGEDYFTEGDIASLGIPHKTSELENDSNFATNEEVNTAINNINIPESNGAEDTEIFLLKMPRCEYANSLFSANHSKMTDEIKQSILYVIDAFTKKGILYPCIKLTGEYLVGSGGGTGAIFKATGPCQPPTSSGVCSYSFEAIGSTRGSTSNGVPLLQIEIAARYDSTTQTWSEPDPTYYTMLRHRVNSDIQFATNGYLNNWYLSRGNTTAFTPTGDYNPATKKYVDDAIANIDVDGGNLSSNYLPFIDLNAYHTTGNDFYNNGGLSADGLTKLSEFFTEHCKSTGLSPLTLSFIARVKSDTLWIFVPNTGISAPGNVVYFRYSLVGGNILDMAVCEDYFKYTVVDDAITIVAINGGTFTKTMSYTLGDKVLTKANTTAFTPTGDYNPATKKYVDDSIANIDIPETGGEVELPIPTYTIELDYNLKNSSLVMLSNFAEYKNKIIEVLNKIISDGNAKNYKLVFTSPQNYGLFVEFAEDDPTYPNLFALSALGANERDRGVILGYSHVVNTSGSSQVFLERFVLALSIATDANGVITNLPSAYTTYSKSNIIHTTNTTAFTPTGDYNPATKKYVDDSIKAAITTVLEAEY